ncbi:MAG: TadE family protein [Pseudomonadota bacterium]
MQQSTWHFQSQQGQAMAEFVAVIGIFIVALLALPYLAKLGDVRQTMEQAARHAAWERTVWLGEAQKADKGAVILKDDLVEESIRHHFFTGDVKRKEMTEGAMTPQHSYWQDIKGTPMIKDIADVEVTTTDSDSPAWILNNVLGPLFSAVTWINTAVSGATGNGAVFAIDTKGLYKSTVTAKVNDQIGGTLNFNSNVTLLANEWYGGGRNRVEKKVQGLVLTAVANTQTMQDWKRAVNNVDKVFGTNAGCATSGCLVFGKASDDGIPDDRKELVKKWEAPRYAGQPSVGEPIKEFRMYQYVPSSAAVLAMPLNLGVIDPTNGITQLLP